jgi:hypothetical protein
MASVKLDLNFSDGLGFGVFSLSFPRDFCLRCLAFSSTRLLKIQNVVSAQMVRGGTYIYLVYKGVVSTQMVSVNTLGVETAILRRWSMLG